MTRKVLAFFAHPDDESYAAAGLLGLAVRRGCNVHVVSATRGELGSHHGNKGSAGTLGQLRSRELGAACRLIGAHDPRFLGLGDGAVTAEAAAKALAPLLSEFAPDLIVTHGPDGAYGHRDHVACSEAVTSLDPLAAVLHTVFPRGLFAPVWKALRRFDLIDLPVEALGVDPETVSLRVPLDPELERIKRDALAAHDSQLDDGDPRSFMRLGLVDPLLREEWYSLASGEVPTPYAAFLEWLGG